MDKHRSIAYIVNINAIAGVESSLWFILTKMFDPTFHKGIFTNQVSGFLFGTLKNSIKNKVKKTVKSISQLPYDRP